MSLLALALGVVMSNGATARVQVMHNGPPIPVEIVGIDAQDREVPLTALPSRLRIGNGRPRIVRVQFPSNVVALCAAYSSPSARLRSCSAQINLRERNTSNSRTGSRQAGYLSTLRQALDVTRQEPIELQLPSSEAKEESSTGSQLSAPSSRSPLAVPR